MSIKGNDLNHITEKLEEGVKIRRKQEEQTQLKLRDQILLNNIKTAKATLV